MESVHLLQDIYLGKSNPQIPPALFQHVDYYSIFLIYIPSLLRDIYLFLLF